MAVEAGAREATVVSAIVVGEEEVRCSQRLVLVRIVKGARRAMIDRRSKLASQLMRQDQYEHPQFQGILF